MRILFILLAAITLASCSFTGTKRLQGSGKVTSVEKDITGFESVDVSGAINVQLRQDSNFAVKLSADDNLVEYVVIEKNGSTLSIHPKKGYDLESSKIIVYVSAPLISKIELTGSGRASSEGSLTASDKMDLEITGSAVMNLDVACKALRAEVTGSGSVTLAGRGEDLNLEITGSGQAKCIDFVSDNAKVEISGAADASVTANKTLDVEVSGSGNIRYKGDPKITQSVAGSGNIQKVE